MQARNQLWIMLFSGVMLHMICIANFQFALTSILPLSLSGSEKTTATCQPHNDTSLLKLALQNQTVTVAPPAQTTQPTITIEWASKTGIVLGSFSWFLGIARLIGGVLCQRFGGKTVLGFSNFLLAVFDIMIPFSINNFNLLVIIRSLQGLVGGVGGPHVSAILCSKWVPQDERSKFMTISSGMNFGIASAFLISSLIIWLWNWQATFIFGGSGTLIWCILWYYLVADSPQQHRRITAEEKDYIEEKIGNTVSRDKLPIPWMSILLSKAVLVNIFCDIFTSWATFTCVLYLPMYYKNVLGLKIYETGIFSALPYALHAIYAFSFGFFIDQMIHRSVVSADNARKIAMFFGCILTGVLFLMISLFGCGDIKIIIFLVTLALVLNGSVYSGTSANVVDISPNFCSVIYGLQGFLSSSTGYLAPMTTNYILNNVDTIEQWGKVFQFIGTLSIISGVVFILFGTSSVQSWNYRKGDYQNQEDLLKKIEKCEIK